MVARCNDNVILTRDDKHMREYLHTAGSDLKSVTFNRSRKLVI